MSGALYPEASRGRDAEAGPGTDSQGQDVGPSRGPCTDAFVVGAAGAEGRGCRARGLPAPPQPPAVRSFEQQLEQEQRALQQLRRRLHSEVAEEKERLDQQAARCRREGPPPPPPPRPGPAH